MAEKNENAPKKEQDKYIISITHEGSFKERRIKITKRALWLIIYGFVIAIIVLTYILTSRTSLKRTIPGYPDAETEQMMINNAVTIDSLQRVIDTWAFQVENIKRVITGREPLSIESDTTSSETFDNYYGDDLVAADSSFREDVLERDQFNLSYTNNTIDNIEGMNFFCPVKGVITNGFNLATNHPYVDVAAQSGSIVYSVLDGTVIASYWSDETGYTIHLQHSNDLISIYKHNDNLIKHTGDKVSAGTPIAYVGNTGRLSTGQHLHFELWHKGECIDPTLYINF